MAELGGTDDPRALIPGDSDAIAANAVALRQRAADAADAGDGLRAIDTGAWTGPAAERFHDKFSYEPGRGSPRPTRCRPVRGRWTTT